MIDQSFFAGRSFAKDTASTTACPEYIQSGNTSINKRIAEKLFKDTHYMEIECENPYRIWAYGKAAWSVDESKDGLEKIYSDLGSKGLKTVPGVGETLSLRIEKEIKALQQEAIEMPHSPERGS